MPYMPRFPKNPIAYSYDQLHEARTRQQATVSPVDSPSYSKAPSLWILAYARSGSWWLTGILNEIGLDPPIAEWFNPSHYQLPKVLPPNNKMMPQHMRRLKGLSFKELVEAMPSTKFILLRRRDLIACAVSRHVARHTGAFFVNEDRVQRRLSTIGPASFDSEKLLARYRHAVRDDKFWHGRVRRNRVDAFELFYEDLDARPLETITSLFEWAGIGADPRRCLERCAFRKISAMREETAALKEYLSELIESNHKTPDIGHE